MSRPAPISSRTHRSPRPPEARLDRTRQRRNRRHALLDAHPHRVARSAHGGRDVDVHGRPARRPPGCGRLRPVHGTALVRVPGPEGAAARRLADDPVAGPFLRPELLRTAALERDLAHLRGPDWRAGAAPLPATAAYAERVEECARTWPGGYVAHHYTRYLGDLSGGQIIRDKAERTWGFPRKGDGVRFYVFEGIPNPAAFKRTYRELLDGVRADDLERQRIVDECKRAFALNTAVFHELGREFPAQRVTPRGLRRGRGAAPCRPVR